MRTWCAKVKLIYSNAGVPRCWQSEGLTNKLQQVVFKDFFFLGYIKVSENRFFENTYAFNFHRFQGH